MLSLALGLGRRILLALRRLTVTLRRISHLQLRVSPAPDLPGVGEIVHPDFASGPDGIDALLVGDNDGEAILPVESDEHVVAPTVTSKDPRALEVVARSSTASDRRRPDPVWFEVVPQRSEPCRQFSAARFGQFHAKLRVMVRWLTLPSNLYSTKGLAIAGQKPIL